MSNQKFTGKDFNTVMGLLMDFWKGSALIAVSERLTLWFSQYYMYGFAKESLQSGLKTSWNMVVEDKQT